MLRLRKKLLDYYATINAAYLHAYAEAGTEFLLQELNIAGSESILEIGFGTGGTLVKVKARNPSVTLVGIDKSDKMLQRAKARLAFCGIKDVTLQKINEDHTFPFGNNTFDKIYVESVLGIQEKEHLELMVSEVFRVLKPGGKLTVNETVWLSQIDISEIEAINAQCRELFGIIQASADYPYSDNWLLLFKHCGFATVEAKRITVSKTPIRYTKAEFYSRFYTRLGKIKAWRPAMTRELRAYEKAMRDIYEDKQYMEGLVFNVCK